EPPRYCYRQPLKLVRLPVPPLPHRRNYSIGEKGWGWKRPTQPFRMADSLMGCAWDVLLILVLLSLVVALFERDHFASLKESGFSRLYAQARSEPNRSGGKRNMVSRKESSRIPL